MAWGRFSQPTTDVEIALFAFVGDLLLLIWFLWRGIKGFDKALESKS
jgi:hypothetical protein